MSFTSEEKGEQIKLVWSAQMALLEQRQDRNSLIRRRKEIIQCWKLGLYSSLSPVCSCVESHRDWGLKCPSKNDLWVLCQSKGHWDRQQKKVIQKTSWNNVHDRSFTAAWKPAFLWLHLSFSHSWCLSLFHSLKVLNFSEWYGLLTVSW